MIGRKIIQLKVPKPCGFRIRSESAGVRAYRLAVCDRRNSQRVARYIVP
ncbi:MAG: hypothetical protein ACI8W8_002170 [Rhodothermales bacterium]|jgi:hypothetical protein